MLVYAVSYTHLDVYKRQGTTTDASLIIFILTVYSQDLGTIEGDIEIGSPSKMFVADVRTAYSLSLIHILFISNASTAFSGSPNRVAFIAVIG